VKRLFSPEQWLALITHSAIPSQQSGQRNAEVHRAVGKSFLILPSFLDQGKLPPHSQKRENFMTSHKTDEQLSEDRRKEIFLALVDAQDHEMSVAQSRNLMAQRFGVNENQVRLIEREGMELQWPPLG
jgi:hypothetical protein